MILKYLKAVSNIYYKTLLQVMSVLPVIFINSNREKFIILIIFALIFYLYKRNNNKLSYGETSQEFKKAFIILLVILTISGINFNSLITNKFIIPYMVFYFVFTVLLLRYLRNYQFNGINDKLNKINTIYFIFVIISALIFALKSVRKSVFIMFLYVYRNIMSVFIYIFSRIVLLISNLFKNIRLKKISGKILQIDTENSKLAYTDYAGKDFALSHPLFYNIITILVIILAIYIIIKVLNKRAVSLNKSEKCEETKEFIFYEKSSKKLKRGFIFGDYSSQIKYYYRKLMKDLVSKGINLNKSDTTMDIYSKSKEAFGKASLKSMRDLYIEVRYGNKACTKEKVKQFIYFYKNRKL